jgi:murein DD-endopeptidase MepM/ murein hydrolase activator NlpD
MRAICIVCRTVITDGERFVLMRGRRREAHCSQACLVETVGTRRHARAAARRRRLLAASAIVLALGGGRALWQRFHQQPPEWISYDPPELRPAPAPRPEPIFYGPPWPPTDDDWRWTFAHAAWTYPLPGPARRTPAVDDRVLAGPEPARHGAARAAVCHDPRRCGVDLGGPLWGEHVYAVLDGVVDRVQHAPGDEPGGVYLRLAHRGGMVFTHYFHLAAVPRGVARGAPIKAGDVIGLVGETGNEHPGRYVHFALSVRPGSDFPEVYWDPTPLMADWPLRLPAHGTVAGFVPPETDLDVPSLRRRAR